MRNFALMILLGITATLGASDSKDPDSHKKMQKVRHFNPDIDPIPPTHYNTKSVEALASDDDLSSSCTRCTHAHVRCVGRGVCARAWEDQKQRSVHRRSTDYA